MPSKETILNFFSTSSCVSTLTNGEDTSLIELRVYIARIY